jgi:S-formylglutathione hydrolase FrmB
MHARTLQGVLSTAVSRSFVFARMPRMKIRVRGSLLRQILLFLIAVSGLLQAQSGPLYFRIKLDPALGSQPRSGRLLIFLSSSTKPEKELSLGFGPEARSVRVEAREIEHLDPGATIEVYGNEPSYPAPLAEAPAGDYQAMALLDVSHRYVYNRDESGDVRSVVVPLKQLDPAHAGAVDLTLSIGIPENPTPTPAAGELLDFESPALSAFWGRPIHMRGVVVLPPDYQKATRRYPTVYWTHGFSADLAAIAERVAPRYAKAMASGDLPPMIYVLLDESCPGGTHEFADSVNNGPWGKALTTDLIPYLEKKYRMTARPSGRLLTGHSSGGWAALWLQVAYPRVFGGTWPTAPDPSDFHAFTGPDLRATPTPNFYHDAQGKPWPLVRMNGQEVMSLEEYSRQEYVLGAYGGQMTSFEWVFSPRAKDGTPEQLFDRATGVVNPEVAKAWEKYDIAEILRRNAAQLRPLLQDKIHLTVGTADTFHLDTPAHLLDETMKQLGIRATFTYLPGKSHFDLYNDGLMKQIGKEMEATAEQGNPKQGVAKQSGIKQGSAQPH